MKLRSDAAFLDELSALLGDRLMVHASDQGARLDLDATFRELPDDAIAVMCGPMPMLEAARRAWNNVGREPADLRYETFGSSGLKPTAAFRVRLRDSNTELVYRRTARCSTRAANGVCAVDVVAVETIIATSSSDQQKQNNRKICPACPARSASSPLTRCTGRKRLRPAPGT